MIVRAPKKYTVRVIVLSGACPFFYLFGCKTLFDSMFGHVQVNKAQYKESDCARELKRGSITSFFSPSPKKKQKLEEASDPATATTMVHENTCSSKAEPGIKNEQLSTDKVQACEIKEVPADQFSKEELQSVNRV